MPRRAKALQTLFQGIVHELRCITAENRIGHETLKRLVSSCQTIESHDLGLRIPTREEAQLARGGPVEYQHIWQDPSVTIAIFILPPGAIMPLHNHPNMTVISQLLYGSMEIQSLDLLDEGATGELPALVQAVEYIHAPHTSVLQPDFRNIHSFQADKDIGCAILDILSPSYDPPHDRGCTYYNTDVVLEQGSIVPLHKIDQPLDFHVVNVPYNGPCVS